MENKNNQNMKFKDLKDLDRTTKTGFAQYTDMNPAKHRVSLLSDHLHLLLSSVTPTCCTSSSSTSMDLPRVFLFPSYWDAPY